MTLEKLQGLIRQAGFTNSVADWEDERFIYAFSQEGAGPATYGHPMATASYNKETGWLVFPLPNGDLMRVKAE